MCTHLRWRRAGICGNHGHIQFHGSLRRTSCQKTAEGLQAFFNEAMIESWDIMQRPQVAVEEVQEASQSSGYYQPCADEEDDAGRTNGPESVYRGVLDSPFVSRNGVQTLRPIAVVHMPFKRSCLLQELRI